MVLVYPTETLNGTPEGRERGREGTRKRGREGGECGEIRKGTREVTRGRETERLMIMG